MRQEFFGKVLPPGITIWVQKLLYSANSGQLEGLPILLCLWDVLNCNWIRLTSLYTHKLSRILINTLIYFTVRLTNLFVVLFQVSQRKRCVVGKRNRVSTKQLRVMSLALVVIPFSHLCTIQWSIFFFFLFFSIMVTIRIRPQWGLRPVQFLPAWRISVLSKRSPQFHLNFSDHRITINEEKNIIILSIHISR